jgi:hypothetical protein
LPIEIILDSNSRGLDQLSWIVGASHCIGFSVVQCRSAVKNAPVVDVPSKGLLDKRMPISTG